MLPAIHRGVLPSVPPAFFFVPSPVPPLGRRGRGSTRVVIVTPHRPVIEIQVILLFATVIQTVVITYNPVEVLRIFP
jgi:hypothetical protein